MSEAALDPTLTRPTDTGANELLDPYSKAGRRTKLAVSWENKAIARDLGPHLKSLTYTDNLTGAADDLTLELEDRDELWSDAWRPEYGDQAVARLEVTDPWFGDKVTSLRLGTFTHDGISLDGPPWRVSLKCISAPLSAGMRRRKRTHAWRGVTLKQIAQDIADRAGVSLDFDGDAGSSYKQALQNNKSDLDFLEERCKELGRTLKITEGAIVIYDEQKMESAEAAGEIDLRGGRVLGWSFPEAEIGRYGACRVTCFDPRTGKKVEGQFPPDGVEIPGLDPNGQTLELTINVSDISQAVERAKAALRNANRFAATGTITVVGDPGLVAGVVFNLENAAGLSGKFIVTKATHVVSGGYTTALEVRRCSEGY